MTDLEPLRAVIGDARIVSLGEATHGTREFFKLKHRILEFCVAELGFTVFVIEANFPETLAVNAYVLDGVGTAADALAGMRFWIWNTEEVLDLIEWMRWWNANNPRKVKFYGFTMSYPAIAALGLIDFLDRCDPALAAHCKTELAPLTSDFTAGLFGQLPEARRESIFGCIAQVLAAFAQQRPAWVAATSDLDWHLGRLHAIVLDQGARFELKRNAAFHERSTAANVVALLEAEGLAARAILWSHNDHAMRDIHEEGNSMGQYLDEMVGRAQVVVGMSFDRGAFAARDYPSGELIDHAIEAAPLGSFDAALAQSGPPLFALDLANAPREGRVAEWLASEMPMRKIGGILRLAKRQQVRSGLHRCDHAAQTLRRRPVRCRDYGGAAKPACPDGPELGRVAGAVEPGIVRRRHSHRLAAARVRSKACACDRRIRRAFAARRLHRLHFARCTVAMGAGSTGPEDFGRGLAGKAIAVFGRYPRTDRRRRRRRAVISELPAEIG